MAPGFSFMIDYKKFIKNVEDFPKPGIIFKDIQPLFDDKQAFYRMIVDMREMVDLSKVDYVVGIESRGFPLAAALAVTSNCGFKMIRKAGKLPKVDLTSMEYGLEYGRDTMEIKNGSGKVVIVDDVFATGGTMTAAALVCESAGYEVVDKICMLDIGIVEPKDVKCLISY